MDEKAIKKILIRSAEEVFEKTVSWSVTEQKMDGKHQFKGEYHLTATIGFAGKWNGFVSIQCSEDLAFQITSRMLNMDIDNLEKSEVRDALGEIVNMIGGRFKAIFAELYNSGKEAFKMSVPSIIMGRDYQLYAVGSDSDLVIVLATKKQKITMELVLKEIMD